MEHVGTRRLETARLILRRYVPEDARQMYAHWASDDAVTKYLTWPTHPDEGVTQGLIDNWVERYADPSVYHWGIELRDGGALIGDISVVHLSERARAAELGWCMGRAWWGKGYMPEAARAVLRYLFRDAGFNRVCAAHDVNNPKSGRVMQKIGMRFEGIGRQEGANKQGLCDLAHYAILAEEFVDDGSTALFRE